MIDRIGQLALVFKDVPAAVAFYRDTLGLSYLFSAGPALSFFDCGGVMLMFSGAEKPKFDHPNNIVYFSVGDIHLAHRELAQKGVRFEEPPKLIAALPTYDLWMAFFRDPENNLLALRSEVKK